MFVSFSTGWGEAAWSKNVFVDSNLVFGRNWLKTRFWKLDPLFQGFGWCRCKCVCDVYIYIYQNMFCLSLHRHLQESFSIGSFISIFGGKLHHMHICINLAHTWMKILFKNIHIYAYIDRYIRVCIYIIYTHIERNQFNTLNWGCPTIDKGNCHIYRR